MLPYLADCLSEHNFISNGLEIKNTIFFMYLIIFLTPINRKFYKQHQIASHHQPVKRNAIEIKMTLSW